MENTAESARQLARAATISAQAHEKDVDKSGEPYFLHPFRIAQALSPLHKVMTVAFLHDVVEDTDITIEDLSKEGFDLDILAATEAITRRDLGPGSYDGYLKVVQRNLFATMVKVKDIEDNLSVQRLSLLPIGKAHQLFTKYSGAKSFLWESYMKYSKDLYGRII